MTLRVAMMTMLVGGMAWAAGPAPGQAPPPAGQQAAGQEGTAQGVIDPRADQALRRMSNYLSGLQSARVQANTVDEKFTKQGQKIQELHHSTVVFQRPNELRVDRVGPAGHVTFRYDGRQFAVYNQDKQVYATAPAPPRLGEAIDQARDRLHIDAPGGDLLVNDPYSSLVEGTRVGRYIGLEPIDGVMAHHLAFTRGKVDWQIWIKDGPEPVPLRYVITSKDLPGQPQFTLTLRNWQPNVQVPATAFSFTPPSGARRVAFAPPRKAER